MVYDDGWVATSDEELQERIDLCIREVTMHKVARLATDTEQRITEMYESGRIKEMSDKKKKYSLID